MNNQSVSPNPNRRPAIAVIIAAAVLALIVVGGVGFVVGGTVAHNQTAHNPPVATALAAATATSEVIATQTALPTATPLPAVNPLAGASILTSEICASTGTGCNQGTTNSFTTLGPFVILYICYVDHVSQQTNAQLQLQVFNAAGRQVDVLSEACQGTTFSQGIISEKLPAGSYTITVGATTGPSWDIVVLEDEPSAST
jgi:hypothetical protein